MPFGVPFKPTQKEISPKQRLPRRILSPKTTHAFAERNHYGAGTPSPPPPHSPTPPPPPTPLPSNRVVGSRGFSNYFCDTFGIPVYMNTVVVGKLTFKVMLTPDPEKLFLFSRGCSLQKRSESNHCKGRHHLKEKLHQGSSH